MRLKKSFLIVGGGISGTTLTFHLLKRGVKVTLIDNKKNDCSKVAGALITPIVFRRMNKSWQADKFVPYIKTYYSNLEKTLNTSFFKPLKLRRMFSSEQERELWDKRSKDGSYDSFITPINDDDMTTTVAKNDFGSGRLKNCFAIFTDSLFEASESYLSDNGVLKNEEIDYSKFNGLTYNGVRYDGIIFSEGHHSNKNPWFSGYPVNKTKGEVLRIKANSLPNDLSVNRKCFILPVGNHEFKVGSTYSWHDDSLNITKEGKDEILTKLAYLTDEKIEVIHQEAGVRPTTIDRRPIIGEHPTKKGYYLFNGLGTKGFFICPPLADEFVKSILDGEEINSEVKIERFH